MTDQTYNVLFLCTGNSARSILAEALLATVGKGRFRAFSAGSQPAGIVQPIAADIARELGYDEANLRSKSWDEFAVPGAPHIDMVVTVCDSAAAETCPIWPGHPATAHWGVPDPAQVEGDEATRRRAFVQALTILRRRVDLLVALPVEKLDKLAAQSSAREIGQVGA